MELKWKGGTKEEYESQYFGFGTQRIKIAFNEMVKSNIHNSVKSMEDALKNKIKLSNEEQNQLTEVCDELVSLYVKKSTDSLATLNRELEKMFSIPDGLLLQEDDAQNEQYGEDDVGRVKMEIVSLQKRCERAAVMEAYIKSELEELKSNDHVFDRVQMATEMHKCLVKKMGEIPKVESKVLSEVLDLLPMFDLDGDEC